MWIALMLTFVLFVPVTLWFVSRYQVPQQVLYAGICTGLAGVFTCAAIAFHQELFFLGAGLQGLGGVVGAAWSWRLLKGKPLARRSPVSA